MTYLTKLNSVGKIAFCACLMASLANEVTAADSNKVAQRWQDIGASERVDFSGRLHMLSQRIAASTCNMKAGQQPEISKGILLGSTDELDRILHALRNGNPRMKIIGEERNPRVLGVLASVETQWVPVRQSIKTENGAFGSYDLIEAWNTPFFEDSNLLVSEIAAEYSDPADLLQRDAILVDLAGRQRMRTQMLLKQGCDIWRDGGTDQEIEHLLGTVDLFERTLTALRFGAKDVGLKPAPNEGIELALADLSDDWSSAKSQLLLVAAGRELSDADIGKLYLQLNDMLIQSDHVVRLYTTYAKHSR